ncbi:MAG: phosphatidate cytidylyltransferase [Oscillospiraceae bacterium]
MKQRIISGTVGMLLLIAAFFLFDTIFFDIAFAFVSVLAVYELLCATKFINNRLLSTVSLVFSALVAFFRTPYFNEYAKICCVLFVIILLAILFIKRKTVTIEKIGTIFFVSLCLPLALCSALFMKNEFGIHAEFYVIFCFAASWISDIGAYFTGIFFGKHKMAPSISPNKTIEGLIGGIIFDIIGCLFVAFIYSNIFNSLNPNNQITFNYWLIGVITLILAIVSVLGDLTASIIKRQCSIKDFGSILPGHGGVLDRFDSFIFVAPVVYFIVLYLGKFIILTL